MTNNPRTRGKDLTDAFEAAEQFIQAGSIVDIREYGNGNINDTFLVTTDSRGNERFLLQRLNTRVFRNPGTVMQNIRIATEHIRQRAREFPAAAGRRWETPRILPTRGLADLLINAEGSCWRAMSFIGGTESFDTVRSEKHAREVGFALGMFHSLLSDLPADRLEDTLEGFHVTPVYVGRYEKVLAEKHPRSSPDVKLCMAFIEKWKSRAGVLEQALASGRLHSRPIHGDPKVNNILMDEVTREAVAIVDLDTVKPGLIHYDIGDCLRSSCNPMGEAPGNWEAVRFEPDFCRAVMEGYFSVAAEFVTMEDRRFFFDAAGLIAFELGLRFFTDYLEGNVYFKVGYKEHNLARALVQFRLAESIVTQETAIREIVG